MSSGETLESSAARVRALRLANGLTQEELAHRLGVSFVSVNRWENERTRPAASVWRKLVDLQPSVALSPLADEPLGLFIGRSAELNMLESLVATHRLVTLTGPGGCGKTRLALAGC